MRRELALTAGQERRALSVVGALRARGNERLIEYCQSDGECHALLLRLAGLVEKREWRTINFSDCWLELRNGSMVAFCNAGPVGERVEEAKTK